VSAGELRVGLSIGYWKASPDPRSLELARLADEARFDSIWVSESWGSDAFAMAAWLAGQTTRVKIGTAVVQMAARTPTATAMAASTIDHLSDGRFLLGLGISGPQVVEGWYGRPSDRPLARTREYVEIIRRVLAREEPLEFQGDCYQHPYRGPGSSGLGKPLRIMTHPLRADLPILIGCAGPKNVAQTADIADGWLPLYYSPFRPDVYADALATARPDFEVHALLMVAITDDVAAGLAPVKEALALYIGGMGARGANYHFNAIARLGYEAEAEKVQELFLSGRRQEAVLAVPDALADEISLVGPPSRIKARLDVWRDSPVTTIIVEPRPEEELRAFARIVSAG
jgi:F420-dependent oxidoreductase-like protein